MRRRRRSHLLLLLVLAALALRLADANPAVAQTLRVPAWKAPADPGLDASGALWQSVPPVVVPLTAQLATQPMGGGSVQSVAVRALHWEERLYLMLEWADSTPDTRSDRPELFSDAAAVQFPSAGGSAVPAICMGQADQAVNIWQWRADSQEGVPPVPEEGYVDLYPSTDELFRTAAAAGNEMALPGGAVQNLVAGGFGTLSPASASPIDGQGVHGPISWRVVFSRPFAPTGELEPALGQGPVDTAFAVWDGGRGERNGIKSVSSFVQLEVTDETHPRIGAALGGLRLDQVLLVLVSGGLVALLALGTVAAVRRSGVEQE